MQNNAVNYPEISNSTVFHAYSSSLVSQNGTHTADKHRLPKWKDLIETGIFFMFFVTLVYVGICVLRQSFKPYFK